MHLRADAPDVPGGQRGALEVDDVGVPVGRGDEGLADVLLGQPRPPRGLALALPQLLRGLRGEPLLLRERHGQRTVHDLHRRLAARWDDDLRGAGPVVDAARDLRLHHRVERPGQRGGVLAVGRERELDDLLPPHVRSELELLDRALRLLDAEALHEELHGVLLVARLEHAADPLGAAALLLAGGVLLRGVELHEEVHVVVRRREAVGGAHGELAGDAGRQVEAELHAEVAEVVELHEPHARGVEDHVAEEQRVLREPELRRVAGARHVEQVDVLPQARLRQQRQLEWGHVVGRGEAELDGQLLLRREGHAADRRPGDAALAQLPVRVVQAELDGPLGAVHHPGAAHDRLVAHGDAEVDVLHLHRRELELHLAAPPFHRHIALRAVVDHQLDPLPVLHGVARREDDGDRQRAPGLDHGGLELDVQPRVLLERRGQPTIRLVSVRDDEVKFLGGRALAVHRGRRLARARAASLHEAGAEVVLRDGEVQGGPAGAARQNQVVGRVAGTGRDEHPQRGALQVVRAGG
mmetsp:Transcript_74852/g.196314  ORF Transcript_74852/g.196314 Transcript_74852/m.196314 type:complete len:524 (-) Transcript_74852:78-1649(-)